MIRPFRGVHPQVHETAFVADSAQVIGDVHIGEQASVWFGTVVRGDMFYIRIGDRANVQDNCVLHTRTGEKPTILEEEVTIGHSVTLHGCYIERQSLIGIGSIVLDDVRVGTQSLVAAGSLVSPGTIIPPRSLEIPPPRIAKLPEKVLFVTVNVAPLLSIPPPALAELLMKALFVTVIVVPKVWL